MKKLLPEALPENQVETIHARTLEAFCGLLSTHPEKAVLDIALCSRNDVHRMMMPTLAHFLGDQEETDFCFLMQDGRNQRLLAQIEKMAVQQKNHTVLVMSYGDPLAVQKLRKLFEANGKGVFPRTIDSPSSNLR